MLIGIRTESGALNCLYSEKNNPATTLQTRAKTADRQRENTTMTQQEYAFRLAITERGFLSSTHNPL
jgi:hypothetical protein